MKPLLILAMDHRDSFEHVVYGMSGPPTPDRQNALEAGKQLIFDGLRDSLPRFPSAADPGVLVDEQFGSNVARQAPADGVVLAMPLEKSGQKLFELNYGDDWVGHLNTFKPHYAKVFVRANPADSTEERHTQETRLRSVSEGLTALKISLLFELLVPASPEQLASVGGDPLRYDAELRPKLTVQVIRAFQEAGVEPAIWKIEGLESPDDARAVVAAARADGRGHVECIVLGRDAPKPRVDHWLEIARMVDGFSGFAVGRSIWEKPLIDFVRGSVSEAQARQTIRDQYLHFVHTYTG